MGGKKVLRGKKSVMGGEKKCRGENYIWRREKNNDGNKKWSEEEGRIKLQVC